MSKQRALEKKAAQEDARGAKAAAENEKILAASWAEGAKSSSKANAAADKEAARLKKQQDMATLLAEEDASNSTVKVAAKKTKKKGKDDFDLLNAALKTMPKTKAEKEKEEKKKAADARKKQEAENRAKREAEEKAKSDYKKNLESKGIVVDHMDSLMVPIQNRPLEDEGEDEEEEGEGGGGASSSGATHVFHNVTGINAALDELHVGSSSTAPPEKRQKAAYKAYCERMLPIMKEELPGLKLSQYKDRMFENWKTAPENPHNQTA